MPDITVKKIIFIGPQGSGKGTQAEKLAAKLGVPTISTGDLFRNHIKQGTQLGIQAQELVSAGKLVPDAITNAMIADRLHQPDARTGWILDGYPRTTEQAVFLDTIDTPECIVDIQLTDAEAIKRITRRRIDADSGATISLDLLSADQRSYYESHPEKLLVRNDDTPEAVTKRLALYRQQTQPVLAYYERLGKVVSVDGTPAIATVADEIERKLVTRSRHND